MVIIYIHIAVPSSDGYRLKLHSKNAKVDDLSLYCFKE